MIYHKEVVKINCERFGYIEIQNEWTGSVKGRLYTLHLDGNNYYCNADGHRVPMNDEYQAQIRYENKIEDALKWYDQTKF